jgi:hypothetical protein
MQLHCHCRHRGGSDCRQQVCRTSTLYVNLNIVGVGTYAHAAALLLSQHNAFTAAQLLHKPVVCSHKHHAVVTACAGLQALLGCRIEGQGTCTATHPARCGCCHPAAEPATKAYNKCKGYSPSNALPLTQHDVVAATQLLNQPPRLTISVRATAYPMHCHSPSTMWLLPPSCSTSQ